MICDHESLEEDASSAAAVAGRRQVVRWRRSFPFAFLSDREYCIARRCWRCPDDPEGSIYTATKTVAAHPRMAAIEGERAARGSERVVQMDVFYSSWRSRTVPCPSGDPGAPPACETLLLHREDFKIPENLARFAVKAGMAGFVKKMAPAVRAFVAERRARGVPPGAHDARAYGVSGAWAAVAASGKSDGVPPGSALPPPPEAATFFALDEDHGAAPPPPPLPLPLSASARPRAASAARASAPPLRGSVSFAQLPPSFSIARRASQEGGMGTEGSANTKRAPPASFALSAMASEESEEASAGSRRAPQAPLPPPRLRRAAASAPQLSSLGSMLASAAQDLADLLPARVGRAVGAALGSPLLGASPPGTPAKGGGGAGEEGAAAAAAPSSPSVRSASPPPPSHPRPSHHHRHQHHSPSPPHHHHLVGRGGGGGRRRGPAGGRARSPQQAPAAAPTENAAAAPAPAAAAPPPPSHAHHHHHPRGSSLPLAADLLRAGFAVAVAVAVASRAGKAAGRAEARAELAEMRRRHEEEGEHKARAAPRRRPAPSAAEAHRA